LHHSLLSVVIVLCCRWGRVGEGGQSSLISTYGRNKEAAVTDFQKKFKV
jgi:predicted DNA-binding WGR domain protein